MLVHPNGGKYLRRACRFGGKQKTLALGVYPDVPLASRTETEVASGSNHERPMSENTVLGALRRMGYGKDEMTAHGFRTMASTRLNESHLFHADAIERQLAHGERDSVRAVYNRAEHLPERRRMMQWWADYLQDLKNGAELIPFNGQAP